MREDVLRPSDHHTLCPWKGTASYYHLEVDGQVNRDAVWYYPDAEGRREGDHGPRRLLARRRGALTAQRAGPAPGQLAGGGRGVGVQLPGDRRR